MTTIKKTQVFLRFICVYRAILWTELTSKNPMLDDEYILMQKNKAKVMPT
jgi:hypothetical protein